MPTYALDQGFFEEYDIPINEAEFTHGPNGELISEFSGETVVFEAEKLDAPAQIVLLTMKGIGVTSLYCRYDGSSDEGFAHFEMAFMGEQPRTLEEMTPLLTSLSEVKPERKFGDDAVVFMNCFYTVDQFEVLAPEQRVREAIDYFAYALACQLLGKGFGTGVEGTMYGAFRANLESGEIVDEYADAPEGTFAPHNDDFEAPEN